MDEEKTGALQPHPPAEEGNEMEGEDLEDLDDFDDLGMFHKSSLREKEEIHLPQKVQEVYGVKRFLDGQNESKIGLYTEHNTIGRGAFAEVIKVERDEKFYAMKIYSLSKLRSQKFFAADGSFANGEEMLQNELNILKRLEHQNLVQCNQILYGSGYTYVVGELCDLGQIMDWEEMRNNYVRNYKVTGFIASKYGLSTMADITRVVFLQAALGLQYLHSHNITNRDIKVDNILCTSSQQQGADIKIADFTTARCSSNDISFFPSGTPGFRGPEQQFATSEGYSCKATDVWSLGISMYTFYMEFFPFMGESELEIDIKAQNCPLEFNEGTPGWLREVVEAMTAKNWKDRVGIDEVVQRLGSHES